jgi:hypothetical protein
MKRLYRYAKNLLAASVLLAGFLYLLAALIMRS